MIKSAQQYPIHTLLSHDGNLQYRVPPYQREYSWQKAEWEDLLQDLVEADGSHFLGTIITLNRTTDAADSNVLELIDGQQRMTTLTLLLAAIYSLLKEQPDLDDDIRIDMVNLGRSLVRKNDNKLRVTPQTQGHNLDDYRTVLAEAGLPVQPTKQAYYSVRRVAKCFRYFRQAIAELATTNGTEVVQEALDLLNAVQHAVLVKIEVASHADAFVLFESLNNRGVPLTPVDLIKNHLLAESERKRAMPIETAFARWNEMLLNLGDSYANHERFLRHYYNAFKADLPDVPNAPVATRVKLIRIYETLLGRDLSTVLKDLVEASRIYGRITCVNDPETASGLDDALRRLMRAQGAPSYILVLWLMSNIESRGLTDQQLVHVVDHLTSFFVRRNLTGFPQTYALPKLFMTIIEGCAEQHGDAVVNTIQRQLMDASSSADDFRRRLEGPIYDENSDVARFILTALAEDGMTKETWTDLWLSENGHYVWTIEHIFPQGENLPAAWKDMMGGTEAAAQAQQSRVHHLGNLTITAYNSNLGNKSFQEKRDRTDPKGRPIGYRNGLALNADLRDRETWTVEEIDERTHKLAERVLRRFPLE